MADLSRQREREKERERETEEMQVSAHPSAQLRVRAMQGRAGLG